MNKYSKMRDVDLLERVLNEMKLTVIETNYKDNYCRYFNPKYECPDYDNVGTDNNSFYFSLMIDNGISLFNRNIDYMATKQTLDTKVIQACSKNPCRAIAECFLLMKDRENKNGANHD